MRKIDTHILELISAYTTNEINKEQYSELQEWLSTDPENKQVFSEYLHLYKKSRRITLAQAIDKTKAWDNILSKLERPLLVSSKGTKTKVKTIHKTWFRYAVAAVIVGILATAYFFKVDLIPSRQEFQTPIIVNNQIEPGTDKATLTLENGSIINLEKGNNYRTPNATSNGEEIIYSNINSTSNELVFNYLTVPRGGQFYIELSDGTRVWLNSESKLKFPISFKDGETRQVELVYGEAYFEVSPSTNHKGSKFKVFNNYQEVEVLGTEFNIKAYKDETNIYTTLVEGKVTVSYNNKKESLTPSEQSVFNLDMNTLTIKTVDVYNEISWKDGIFSFERKTLKEIMKVLSRWYDVEIIIKNKSIENEEFVGVLRKNKKLEDILTNFKKFGFIKNFEIMDDRKAILE